MNKSNPTIWTLTDGSHGMISQTRGLAYEFNKNIFEIKTNIYFPWNKLQPGILPFNKWIFKNEIPKNKIPDMVISCGRKSVYLSIYLKKKFSKIINIHIQNPKISSKYFSFVIAPNHDNLKGPNVINSKGALHFYKKEQYLKKEFKNEEKNLVTCIVGGRNNHYYFSLSEAKNYCKKIKEIKRENPVIKLLVITSRRTSIEIKNYIRDQLFSIAEVWLGNGENPYELSLYKSSFFIITSDSTSMISEASISGKPIYIYKLPQKRKSLRFNRFHEEFNKLNITRDLTSKNILENWSYDKLDESERIAGIIKERIIEGTNESK